MPSIGVTWGSHPEENVRPAFTQTVKSTREHHPVKLTLLTINKHHID